MSEWARTECLGRQEEEEQQQQQQQQQQQNGGGVPEFSSSVPFVPNIQPPPPQQNVVPDFAAFDPTTFMSPMDLYEHIFWESPDPFNTGVDSMNFDFLAHPPPGQPQQQQFYF